MSVSVEWAQLGGEVELYQPGELEDARGQVNDRLGWPIDEVIVEGTSKQFKKTAERILHLLIAEQFEELITERIRYAMHMPNRSDEWKNGYKQAMREASKIFRRME